MPTSFHLQSTRCWRSFGLKRTTDTVNLIDKWLEVLFQVKCDVWNGCETVNWCPVCQVMLFWSARLQSVIFLSWNYSHVLLVTPVHMTAGSLLSLLPSMNLRTTKKIPLFWHHGRSGTVQDKKGASVLIIVVLTLKRKKEKLVQKHCEHVGIQNL